MATTYSGVSSSPADNEARCTAFRLACLGQAGYRCPSRQGGWIAEYSPLLNQIRTDPWCARHKVKRALPEEIAHATTASFRPAQLYPLTNYLTGTDQFPDVNEFRDIIETAYVAMWPLTTDKPVTSRNLPQADRNYRQPAERIIDLARRFAGEACPKLSPAQARREALWAITMLLLYVIPLAPGQCPAVLDLLTQVEPIKSWTFYPQLFEHLFRCILALNRKTRRDRSPAFSLAAPSEPHRNVAVALDLTRHILRLAPADLLPIFPTVLSVVTLHSSNFIPLIWLRARGQRIYAGVEIWDQTSQRRDAALSVIDERLRLHQDPGSSVKDCPTDRFYREVVQALSKFVIEHRPCRPAQVMALSFKVIRQLIRRELAAVWKHARTACPWCQRLVCTSVVQEAADQILATPAKRMSQIAAAMDHYEKWVLSDGLRLIERQLREYRACQLPVVPAFAENGKPLLTWRRL